MSSLAKGANLLSTNKRIALFLSKNRQIKHEGARFALNLCANSAPIKRTRVFPISHFFSSERSIGNEIEVKLGEHTDSLSSLQPHVQALQTIYLQRHSQTNVEIQAELVDTLWTATFVCPIEGHIIPSGEQRGLKCAGRDEKGRVLYEEKHLALAAAAARALDLIQFRTLGIVEPRICEEDPSAYDYKTTTLDGMPPRDHANISSINAELSVDGEIAQSLPSVDDADWFATTLSTNASNTGFMMDSVVPSTYSLRDRLGVSDKTFVTNTRVAVVGHRGALYETLENTLPGFQQCAAMGCDAVELDVFVLKDGSLVVFHGGGGDEHPGDLTDYCIGQSGKSILDLTYEETQSLQFNESFGEFPCPPAEIVGARIPLLEEVLLALKDSGCSVKIELKGPGTVEPVLELVERLDMQGQCSYSCFDLGQLLQLRQLRPDDKLYRTGALFDKVPSDDYLERAMAVGATEVHLRYDACTAQRVEEIREAGLRSMAWFRGPIGMKRDTRELFWDVGNEDERCYQAVLDTGVDEICCNRPDVLIRMLGREEQILIA